MRDRSSRITELLVNGSIVVVALVLAMVLVKYYLLPNTREPSAGPQLRAGMSLSLPNLDWKTDQQTVLLVLSKNCHYCTESGPFYRRLVQQAATNNHTRVIAAFSQDVTAARNYLTSLDISINEVMQVSPVTIGTPGTPTVVLVDNRGVVKDVWPGKLSSEKEAEVLARLKVQ
jgi:hypothetical protein